MWGWFTAAATFWGENVLKACVLCAWTGIVAAALFENRRNAESVNTPSAPIVCNPVA